MNNLRSRRTFIQSSFGVLSGLLLPSFTWRDNPVAFRLDLQTATRYFDGTRCWSHARAGIIPKVRRRGKPRIVMTMNSLDLAGTDVFRGMYGLETSTLGKHWGIPVRLNPLSPRYEVIEGIERPVAASDFWPSWHKASKKLLGTGHTVAYTADWKVTSPRPRHTAYSVYDVKSGKWSMWKKLSMPDEKKFYNAGAGCSQRLDMKDGTILLPISFRPPEKNSLVTVCRCSFDGENLLYLDHGTELELNDTTRGLHEPSLTKFRDSFFLTIRNDKRGFVARSSNGIHFATPQPWTFDDGNDLGNYNTQQHWVTHSDGLYLVYTRRGANNDHVFRHRAPLFIARVDPERLCVIRETEKILVPDRGARLGNFGITDVSQHETWVTVSEWMQPKGVEKYGSDGSVFVARILWDTPNRVFKI